MRLQRLTLYAGCGVKAVPGASIGIDISEKYIRRARTLSPAGWFAVADVNSIPLIDGVCDEVVCWEVMEHVYDKEALVDDLARVCKPGGRLVLSCPTIEVERFLAAISSRYRESVLSTQHRWAIRAEDTVALVQRRFAIDGISYATESWVFCVLVVLVMDRLGLVFNDAGELVGDRAEVVHRVAARLARLLRPAASRLNRIWPGRFAKSIILECHRL
jgi:SAM-dependent methyltransferase